MEHMGCVPRGFRISQLFSQGQWQSPRLDGQDLSSVVSLLMISLHRACGHLTLLQPPVPAPLTDS